MKQYFVIHGNNNGVHTRTYGLACRVDHRHTIRLDNLLPARKPLCKLAALLNRGHVSYLHFQDIVDDQLYEMSCARYTVAPVSHQRDDAAEARVG